MAQSRDEVVPHEGAEDSAPGDLLHGRRLDGERVERIGDIEELEEYWAIKMEVAQFRESEQEIRVEAVGYVPCGRARDVREIVHLMSSFALAWRVLCDP